MRKKSLSLKGFSYLLLIIGLFILITPETSNAPPSSVMEAEKNVSVRWNKQKKAKKYIIYRKKDNGKFVRIATMSKKKEIFFG